MSHDLALLGSEEAPSWMAPVNDLVANGSPAAKEAKQKPLAGGNNSAVIVLWYSKMLDLD